MKTKFTYDFANKAIVGTKTSIARANKGLNPEYADLTQKLAAHPDFVVKEKVIDYKHDRKTYSKLTLQRMHDYISLLPNSEERLAEFDAIKTIAEARGAKYPLTKKWFLNTYPEFKENEIIEMQTANLITKAIV